ncbi:MAG: isoprenylcysteine carboxylmethyltransferase family protein [Bacteroidota bacterium]
MDIRALIFRLRSYTPIPFIILILFFAQPTVSSLILGFLFTLLGECIRFWGVGIIGSETRTTEKVDGSDLFTSGPFSFVRNPLYIGNMLMYCGIAVMSDFWMPYFSILVFVFFAIQYNIIVHLEEEFLKKKFGEAYVNYCQTVPRFLPRITKAKFSSEKKQEFNFLRGLKSEVRTLQAFLLLIVALVALKYIRG